MIIVSGGQHVFTDIGPNPGFRCIFSICGGIELSHGLRSGFCLCRKVGLKLGHVFRIIIGKAFRLCLIHQGLHLLKLRDSKLVKEILPGQILTSHVGLLIHRKRYVQAKHGHIRTIHIQIAGHGVIIVVIILHTSHIVIPYSHIGIINGRIFSVRGCAKGNHNRCCDHHHDKQADYFKALPGSALFFLLYSPFFHSSIVSCYDLVRLLFCLFFLRHLSYPPCISPQELYLIYVKLS